MTEQRPADRAGLPACRWRTSAETLDLIEALERIEALLIRLDERLLPRTADPHAAERSDTRKP